MKGKKKLNEKGKIGNRLTHTNEIKKFRIKHTNQHEIIITRFYHENNI